MAGAYPIFSDDVSSPPPQSDSRYINNETVCCVLIALADGLVVIRRGNPHESGFGQLALPGGFQDGSTLESMREAAVREVNEELGWQLDINELVIINAETDEYHHNVIFFETYVDVTGSYFIANASPNDEVIEIIITKQPVESCYPLHTKEISKFFERRSYVYDHH